MAPEDTPPKERLLIVEDDAAFARTLARSFERRDHEVRVAASHEQLLEQLLSFAPTRAVVDLKLQGEASGLACVQALHALVGGDIACHPDHCFFVAIRLLQGADAAFKPNRFHRPVGCQSQYIACAQFIFNDQHFLAGYCILDFLHKPLRLVCGENIRYALAKQ